MKKKYFAYGSNMDENQMRSRCPNSVMIGVGKLKKPHQFIINQNGVATIIPNNEHETYGLIWEFSLSDESRLDIREGVKRGVYSKEDMGVIIADEEILALVYSAANNISGKNRREGYMEKIVKAAEEHSLPKDYVEELKTWLKLTSMDHRRN